MAVKNSIPGGRLHAGDVVATGAAVVATCGVAALACSFLTLTILLGALRGQRGVEETRRSVMLKEGIFVFAVISELVALVGATYVCANKSGYVTSDKLPQDLVNQFVALSGKSLAYKDQRPVVSYVIVGWICWISTVVSTILVSLAARHVLKHSSAQTGNDGDGNSGVGGAPRHGRKGSGSG
jgi:hypothetical protein